LEKTRKADIISLSATRVCDQALSLIDSLSSYKDLMGLEGWAAKNFFSAYFQQLDWSRRMPRAKIDILNVTMDIGYTILFNYLESYIRMFGFDVYIGIYHRLWFKRKSLICDLIEPFRCIIDRQIRKSFNIGQFSENDFKKYKNEFYLKNECCKEYYHTFFSAIIEYKVDIFKYFQQYYRCFMSKKTADAYPFFNL
jgi:CRISPR-associated endonuclease Cas1